LIQLLNYIIPFFNSHFYKTLISNEVIIIKVAELSIPSDGMTDDMLREIYLNSKRIAVVGMSRDPEKDSHRVALFLREKDYEIIPVNPTADYIADIRSYKNILEIPGEIDVVDIFRPSEELPSLIEDIIRKKPKVVWLQLGIYHPSIKELRKHGIKVVWNRCMLREYKRIFK